MLPAAAAAYLINVVMLWFPDVWSVAAVRSPGDVGAGTHLETEGLRSLLPTPPFLASFVILSSFVCAAAEKPYFTPPTPPPPHTKEGKLKEGVEAFEPVLSDYSV